jgi:tetratricopeptide (TPR) repeat protein
MNYFLIILVPMLLTTSSFSQSSYLEIGNQQLNKKDFVSAEPTFREAIKSDSLNHIYYNQLALTLIMQKKHGDAQEIIDKVLTVDTTNLGALWYGGINNFQDKNSDLRLAIRFFEKVMPLLNENEGQYYSANWFIGRSYQILLQSDGLAYDEVSRMLDCYSTYVRLQPNAEDAAKTLNFVEHIKSVRPPNNVKKWINKVQ